MIRIGLGIAALALAACGTVGVVDQSLQGITGQALTPLGDGNTSYSARDSFDGFSLSISYLHPQPNAPEQVVLNGCRQALDLAAIQASQQRGRFINPIDNRAVSVRTQESFTFPGQTVCQMTAPVKYSG